MTALDAFNNTSTGYAGTVHFTGTDGAAVLPANSTLSNGAGTFSATLKTTGSQSITGTDTITGSIMGVGATQRLSAVRWGIVGRIIWAWILTIPLSGFIAAVTWLLLPHG